jgi:hypothetical protein
VGCQISPSFHAWRLSSLASTSPRSAKTFRKMVAQARHKSAQQMLRMFAQRGCAKVLLELIESAELRFTVSMQVRSMRMARSEALSI